MNIDIQSLPLWVCLYFCSVTNFCGNAIKSHDKTSMCPSISIQYEERDRVGASGNKRGKEGELCVSMAMAF